MEEELDISYIETPPAGTLKDLLEIRTMMADQGLDTDSIDNTIHKEAFILAVSTEKIYLNVLAEYKKETVKSKLAIVKDIK